MAADELSVHTGGRAEVDSDLDYDKAVKTTMAQHIVDLFIRETSLVIRHHRDLPGFEPTLLTLVLPVDLCVVYRAPVLATPRVGLNVRLTTNEGISCDGETLQERGFPALLRPRDNLHPIDFHGDVVHLPIRSRVQKVRGLSPGNPFSSYIRLISALNDCKVAASSRSRHASASAISLGDDTSGTFPISSSSPG